MRKLLVTAALVLVACARHDEVPPPLGVAEPPAPVSLVVETVDQINYDLSWGIDDPSVVRYYRIYSKFDYSSPALEDTTTATSVQVNTLIPLFGISFCISAVSVENVESRLTCASAE